jgi:hypothetical protein
MRRVFFGVGITILLLVTACTQEQKVINPQETDIYEPVYEEEARPTTTPQPQQLLQTRWSHLPNGNNWTRYTQEAIKKYGQALLRVIPQDIERYCPKYETISLHQRGDFWVNLITELAYLESSHNPQSSYTERFNDNSGNPVISRGLLQISKESANGSRYRCGINNPIELHDPRINLECGVKILNHWIKEDRVIVAQHGGKWYGVARYWSPFRSRERSDNIVRVTASLGYCR